MILVTGGTGLLGSHLLYQLVEQGERPRALFRNPQSLEQVRRVFAYYSKDAEALYEQIDWVQADLLDLPALESALKGTALVYHCAGKVSFDPADYKELRKANITATANLVNLCIALGVKRLCHVSSIATLGRPVSGVQVDEQTALQTPVSDVYALSKHGAEMEAWRGSQEGLSVVIVNPGVIIGPGFWDTGSSSLVARVAKEPAFYPPGGTGFVGVWDVARIMIELAGSEIDKERFILVAENLSYREFMTRTSHALGQAPPRYRLKSGLLYLLWALDWFRAKLTGSSRTLTRERVRNMRKQLNYENGKIRDAIAYTYESMDKVIGRTCACYQEDH